MSEKAQAVKRRASRLKLGTSATHSRKHAHRRVLWNLLAILILLVSAYILLLVLAPIYTPAPKPGTGWNEPVEQATIQENRVYIPRLSLNLKYNSGDQSVLDDGLWHRFAERGNPKQGGNFILAGHRFVIGLTPGETRHKSPLYNIDKIQAGDYIYVDFENQRYQYEVTHRYDVKPDQIEIESPSETAKMTLYTCTLGGQTDGREVIEAKLIEKNINIADELRVSQNNR